MHHSRIAYIYYAFFAQRECLRGMLYSTIFCHAISPKLLKEFILNLLLALYIKVVELI
jgi:hypothetical protein